MSNKTYSPGSVEKRKSTADNNKSKEKDDMIGLNDKFVQLIDKVKTLENEKQKLDKKLELLKGNESYKGNVDDLVRQMENELEQKIDELVYEKDKLEDDHKIIEKEKIENKKRYEEESKKKNEVEGDCIIARKGVDDGHRNLVDDALKLEKLNRKLDFLPAGFDEEINELKSMIKNESVVLPDESKYSIDMTEIIKKVKAQYANMAARAREDAEYWNQRKIDALVIKSGQREQEARDLKRQISDLNRTIQRHQADLDALKRKKDALIAEINDLRNSGEKDLDKIREDIRSQELALKDRKKDLAQQIKDHQNLLNIKLALDIEIATYRKLLEGEEQRMNQSLANTDVHLPERKHPKKKPQAAAEPTVAPETILNQETTVTPETTESTAITPVQKKRLLIRLEVESGRFVSESSQYTD